MKIYLFNPENGFYLGEDFADEPSFTKGTITIPADATTIAPPQYVRGHVPVFDVQSQTWEIRKAPRRDPDVEDVVVEPKAARL